MSRIIWVLFEKTMRSYKSNFKDPSHCTCKYAHNNQLIITKIISITEYKTERTLQIVERLNQLKRKHELNLRGRSVVLLESRK